MKTLIAPIALAAAFVAAPAAAEAVHQTSVTHEGRTVSVSYAPRVATSHQQTGIGPRASASCLWTANVAVERTVTDAAGRPIAALTRVVSEDQAGSGAHVGHCRDIQPHRMAGFAGDAAKLSSHVAATAQRDAHGLHAELASLDRLHSASAR